MILIKKQVAAKLLVGVAVVGVAFSPVMASAATTNTTVNATVNSAISVASSGTVAISVTPTSGGSVGTGTDTVSVSSNDVDGYNLTLNNDATLTMDGTGGTTGTIAATTGTLGAPAPLSANSWGYRVTGNAAFANATHYARVASTADNIRSTTTTANNEATTVTYGVMANLGLANGTYSDTVTYTATVK